MFSYCFHEVLCRQPNTFSAVTLDPRSPRPSGKSLPELLSFAAIAQSTQFFSRLQRAWDRVGKWERKLEWVQRGSFALRCLSRSTSYVECLYSPSWGACGATAAMAAATSWVGVWGEIIMNLRHAAQTLSAPTPTTTPPHNMHQI